MNGLIIHFFISLPIGYLDISLNRYIILYNILYTYNCFSAIYIAVKMLCYKYGGI